MNLKRAFKHSAAPELPCGAAVQSHVMLCILNELFRTQCADSDAIDAAATWKVIVEELKPYDQLATTLALRYQAGLTLAEAGRILGLSAPRVRQKCELAMRKLRQPDSIARIRNSIVGWANLYRDPRPAQRVICFQYLPNVAGKPSAAKPDVVSEIGQQRYSPFFFRHQAI